MSAALKLQGLLRAYQSCTRCGAIYTEAGWWLLPSPARGPINDCGDGSWLVYRDCECRNTMTVRVGPGRGCSPLELSGVWAHVSAQAEANVESAWRDLKAARKLGTL